MLAPWAVWFHDLRAHWWFYHRVLYKLNRGIFAWNMIAPVFVSLHFYQALHNDGEHVFPTRLFYELTHNSVNSLRWWSLIHHSFHSTSWPSIHAPQRYVTSYIVWIREPLITSPKNLQIDLDPEPPNFIISILHAFKLSAVILQLRRPWQPDSKCNWINEWPCLKLENHVSYPTESIKIWMNDTLSNPNNWLLAYNNKLWSIFPRTVDHYDLQPSDSLRVFLSIFKWIQWRSVILQDPRP